MSDYYGSNELGEFLKGLVELPEMGYYDYDWDRFASFYDPSSRMFYWVSGSGCSCNDLWDDVRSVGDLSVGRKDEFLRAASEFASESYNGSYASELDHLRQEVDSL